MPITTVVADQDSATIVEDEIEDSFRHRFSWSAALAGAAIALGIMFLLLTLGTGVGLSLLPTHRAATTTFLTLGGIYFFASLAMGFAAGGHVVGRLIGPAAETDKEEEFRAGAHGLAVWGMAAIVLTVVAAAAGGMVAGSATADGALSWAPGRPALSLTPTEIGYWTDMLFRPAAEPMHASLAYRQFAQADTTATDASPPADDESTAPRQQSTEPMPMDSGTAGETHGGKIETLAPIGSARATIQHPMTPTSDTTATSTSAETVTLTTPARNIAADKGEVSRILEYGLANERSLSSYDKDRIADLVTQDTGIANAEAERRVENAESRIHANQAQTAETTRRLVRASSLWLAFALLFGAVVATMAAVSARWEDDRITFGWPRRAEQA